MVTRAQLEEWKLHKGPDADEIQEKHLTQPQLKEDVSTFDSLEDLQNLSISSEKLEELIEKFELKVSHSLIEISDLSYLSEIETEGSNNNSLDLEDEDMRTEEVLPNSAPATRQSGPTRPTKD